MLANTIKNIIDDYKNEGKSLTQNDLAKVLGMTKQSFSNKMKRDTFTVADAVKIAEYLNMQLIFKGDKEYIIKQDIQVVVWKVDKRLLSFFMRKTKYT